MNITKVISLQLPWPAKSTGNHATKHTRGGVHYTTATAKAYRARVAAGIAGAGLVLGLPGPLQVEWQLTPPSGHGVDVDNVRKTVADALTLAGFWADDSNKVIRREVFDWMGQCPDKVGAVRVVVSVLGET